MRASKRKRNVREGQPQEAPTRSRPTMVYHHTSSLRTNLIWMSGVIDLEGQTKEGLHGLVYHPQLGRILDGAKLRREFNDFPKLAWFTRRLEVPNVLIKAKMMGERPDGEIIDFGRMADFGKHAHQLGNMLALNRLALGFPTDSIPVIPWTEHFGYNTKEGRELNETAREAGDNPNDWWVSDVPVDVLCATEVWTSSSVLNPKLVKNEKYFPEINRMVTLCRTTKGTFIPPSWIPVEDARKLAGRLGVKVSEQA